MILKTTFNTFPTCWHTFQMQSFRAFSLCIAHNALCMTQYPAEREEEQLNVIAYLGFNKSRLQTAPGSGMQVEETASLISKFPL